MYADTDFLLAMVKEDDWLKSNAEKVYEKYEGEITSSVTAFIEVMLVLEDEIERPEAVLQDLLEIAEPIYVPEEKLFHAVFYMEEGSNVFDAFHAALSQEKVISSDSIYDSLELDRLDLREV
ncbi:MAG: hypothetical protein MUP58_01325 [Candidatus Nanohaloarchaeota archaeon QJJ-9]|nr:hypothetical protein [Candidatus Nanohaloarchaeota archaeon QJJ-9]